MLGQIASGVAHDLNQSLGLIAGHGDLALRALGEPSPNIAALGESLNIVAQAAMDGAGTVRRLLAFGRPALEGPAELVDLGELLGEVARLTAPRWRDAAQAEGRPIRLDTDVAGSTSIAGWRDSLGAALTNLILNAVDALPAGGVIRLAATRSGDQVIVEVTDTGTGMSPGVQAHAFEPFFTTKGGRRTGLGLAMVFGIVERHGGSIALESSPGQGTTFRLSFSASNVADAREDPSTDPSPVVPLRVLAVDDEPALGRMLAQLLQLDGHQVVVASSGEEALGLMSIEPFDLVVADVGMGVGMNGWELARQTLALYPATCFALVTGWGVLIDADEARASGITAVLAKPYRLADLQRLVASVQARQRTATD
jgi:CheY-like chemotaxis protein